MKVDLKTALEQFLIDQELKGNTEKTIKNYRHNVGYLIEFIGKDKFVSNLTIDDLNRYLLYLRKKPCEKNLNFKAKEIKLMSSVTIQTYVRAIRSFLGWLYREEYILENLQQKFKLPKAIRKTIEVLSDEEIEAIMKCYKGNTQMGARNLCIFALMVDCGLRRNEVLTLDYDDIHLSQGIIKVKGKGQKERIVPIGLFTKKVLLRYMSGFRPLPEYPTKRLFIDRCKKPMTEDGIRQLFLRVKAKTGIDRLHPHILRHTFATKYLMNGGDLFSLQQIMGHTTLDMVRKYSHVASAYLLRSHQKYAPLDNLARNKQGF